jgi:hypothetical protein
MGNGYGKQASTAAHALDGVAIEDALRLIAHARIRDRVKGSLEGVQRGRHVLEMDGGVFFDRGIYEIFL